MKKITKFFVIVVALFSMVACSTSTVIAKNIAKNITPVIQAQLIAVGQASQIFKFADGKTTCYITENRTLNTAVGIWCFGNP